MKRVSDALIAFYMIRRRYRIFCLFAAFLLLASVISPAFFSAKMARAANDVIALDGEQGDKILICTAFGMQYVSLADLQKGSVDSDSEDSQATLIKCPICSLNSTLAAADLSHHDALYTLKPSIIIVKVIKSAEHYGQQNESHDFSTRAPPYHLSA